MKPRLIHFVMALCLGLFLQTTSSAQCTNNLGTRTYDTSLVSNGFNIFSLTFPKWSPDSGLLVSVKLSAEVSSQYAFTLKNADVQTATFQLAIGQQDLFSSSLITPFSNLTPPQMIGSYPLLPGQTISQGPFTFLDKHVSSDSITSVAPFLGGGTVDVSYMSFTYTNLSTINNATYYYGATIANTMRFSLQYLYCKSGGVLATNLTRWSAELQAPRTARLEWSAVNEVPGRWYYIQRSSDGVSFTDIASLPAKGDNPSQDYAWSDPLPEGSAGNFYYRLRMDDEGSLFYSSVRQINLAAELHGLRIYPNPAVDYININPGQATAGNWQVEILSANGSLIQRETFSQAQTMHLSFRTRMSAGTYFVRALDLRGQKSFTSSFIVTGTN
ncbi:MAG TPA: T9SS type A sorting domain-containing protein [Puia sp.]|nr:T9SS type A sorting domain-containing protein [Puia sp.]